MPITKPEVQQLSVSKASISCDTFMGGDGWSFLPSRFPCATSTELELCPCLLLPVIFSRYPKTVMRHICTHKTLVIVSHQDCSGIVDHFEDFFIPTPYDNPEIPSAKLVQDALPELGCFGFPRPVKNSSARIQNCLPGYSRSW